MQFDAQIMPIKIAILAMGGEGGGVLADWIVSVAEHAGFYAQTSSVPGVAQRTGATLYYVEILPVSRKDTPAPFLGLMPVPGDVDIVLASELMEAARAVQRGLVTRDKTLLISSSNRVYAMPEKMAMGDGRQDYQSLRQAGLDAAKHFVCQDFAALAQQHGSVISSVLFGALAAAHILPLTRQDFEATIERSGVAVSSSLAAFDAGYSAYFSQADEQATHGAEAPCNPTAPGQLDARLQAHAQRIEQAFPQWAHEILLAGVARTADYQDPAYAHDYLDKLQPIAALESEASPKRRLLQETARHLALWMTFEDTIRVAELKIRPSRFERVRKEHQPKPDQLLHINEFFHPRAEEIVDTVPAGLGRWIQRNRWAHNLLERHTRKGRVIRSNQLGGFLLLYSVAALRSLRRRSLRYQREQAHIRQWLASISQYAHNYDLACEIAACQNLVKGYGDTHARGLSNYGSIMSALPTLAILPDAAQRLAKLRQAALADDHGRQLGDSLAELDQNVAAAP
ncbi:indolepyruvate oxidoreductase subunit beta family protein [Pusillimonas sp. CC-YST705]|uniref:Indolepyruvate oxidoreductase subunit beta family protein n=1 Tax=Mesopusillimonas faecipullorum TaxID=2755040 RepID=A0ABS8CCT0_9BURK|nr:indolepyruvate oxidoreductase subunit beta family protein [Mesopusillimonas faecipullorum]MCB5363808.1 indolepyruvate oxidoreductase subunit beta family protein [Mesopusillimonas faecipullorum]